jgi:hypothetical protein
MEAPAPATVRTSGQAEGGRYMTLPRTPYDNVMESLLVKLVVLTISTTRLSVGFTPV